MALRSGWRRPSARVPKYTAPRRGLFPLQSRSRERPGLGEPAGIERGPRLDPLLPHPRGSHHDDDLRCRGSHCRVPHLCGRSTDRATALFHAARLLLPALERGHPIDAAVLRAAMEQAVGAVRLPGRLGLEERL